MELGVCRVGMNQGNGESLFGIRRVADGFETRRRRVVSHLFLFGNVTKLMGLRSEDSLVSDLRNRVPETTEVFELHCTIVK